MIDGCQDLVGQEVSDGRYRILAKLGEGSMGQVYLAYDNHLQTDVVIKFPARGETIQDENHLLQRFEREIRSLVRLSHPHIVKIIDVGTLSSSPFVVLQYLSGGTLKDRLESGPSGEPRPLPPSTLHEWLLDVAKALDFIHFQGHIHRDVKPANIFFDNHGYVFLGDFGIIKILKTDDSLGSWRHNSLTAPGFLLGTPSYVAPEIVMGYSGDGRSDQYSLALTVYEMLTGCNIMAGPTASATLVNQTMLDPPLLDTLVPGISRDLSETIRRGLGKDPDLRYPTCLAFAKEVLDHVPATYTTSMAADTHDSVPGLLPCPTCRGPVTLAGLSPGQQVRCERCQSVSVLSGGDGSFRLHPSAGEATSSSPPKPVGPWTSGSGGVRVVPDIPGDRPSSPGSAPKAPKRDPRKRGALTSRRLVLGALALTLCGSAVWLALDRGKFLFGLPGMARFGDADDANSGDGQVGAIATPGLGRNAKKPSPQDPSRGAEADEQASPEDAVDTQPITITVAHGTEKKDWLKKAKEEFAKTPQGKRYDINLESMGSKEAADAIIEGPPKSPQIHVWAPASSAFFEDFQIRWKLRHPDSADPIYDYRSVASTPMVILIWKSRHEAFRKKYPQGLNFDTLKQAMSEEGGWRTIAGKPEWGLFFRFGHTKPSQSNSGFMCLLLLAYNHAKKSEGLDVSDVLDPDFYSWLESFERAVRGSRADLDNSTGNLASEMINVGPGPTGYDALLSYENLLVESVDLARKKHGVNGQLDVVYPEPNIMNENPYYILNTPWSHTKEKRGAKEFLNFLLTEEMQRLALKHGFRPGNSKLPIDASDSPLLRFRKNGLKLDLDELRMCEFPDATVLQMLLDLYDHIEKRSPK